MKSKLLLAATAVVLLSVSACKEKIKNCKLGKAYITNGSSTPNPNTFFYNEDGSLSKIKYSNENVDSLVYSADTLWVITRDYRDSVVAIFKGIKNADNNVVSGVLTGYDFMGGVSSTDNYNMTYNADGTLDGQNISNGGGSVIYSYSYDNGNRVGGKKFVGATETENYIFFHSKVENKSGIDDWNKVFTPYFGKPSANLLDSAWTITNGDTIRVTYNHTLDANDYVTKTVQTYLSPGFQTKYYTYQYFDCKE
ncbi:MAG: hypothetical protein U0V74_07475 [Chitinophagales bacterium]